MKSSRPFLALIASIPLIHAAAATAAGIDMDDPRRALGREGDVRVDAQLVRDTVSPGAPIGVALIEEQDGRTKRRLSDELFEKWFECNDTIFLNSVPVQFVPSQASDVESAGGGRMRGGI
ncbi:MAG: hypothetical protein ACXWH7_04625 [Thermoanaerobaculia bacterium]